MPGRAERRADPAALGFFAGPEERVATVSPDPAVVDLVSRDFNVSESNGQSLWASQNLLSCEKRLDRKEAQPEGFCIAALNTVLDAPTEHLVATADTQRRQCTLRSFGEGAVDSA